MPAPASEVLPLFPLNVPLVPGLVLPLHVFEPRYRRLVRELLAEPDPEAREFGIVAVRDGRDVARDGLDALYPVGVATVLREATELDDGRYDILTTGTRRFRLHALDQSDPLARGEVSWLDEPDEGADPDLAARVRAAFGAYREALAGDPDADGEDDGDDGDADGDRQELPDDPTVLSYLVTAAMLLPVPERQRLIEVPGTAERLRAALALLRRERAIIATLRAVPALDLGSGMSSAN